MKKDQALGITVCGSFGFGNAGDEAIPLAIADMANELKVAVSLKIVGRFDNPAQSNVIGMGAKDEHRRKLLTGHPLVISGGGIIEHRSHAVIVRCRSLLEKKFSPTAALLGISVEPGVHFGLRSRFSLYRCLRRFETVYTRDVLSETTLKKLIPNVNTETIGDLVLWMRPDSSELPENLTIPERYLAVVLSPRWSNDSSWHQWITGELRTLSKEFNAPIVFVPMSSEFDDDRSEHQAVAKELAMREPDLHIINIETPLTPRAVSHLLGNAEFVVSMRLHGCVMAYAQQTPFVGLAYHPKLSGFCDTIEWPSALIPRAIPKTQSTDTYGYRFSDLALPHGELVKVAIERHTNGKFDALPTLKTKSLSAFNSFLSTARKGPD